MANQSPPIRKTRRSFNVPGHAHELTFSCINRWPLLASDRTRTWLVESLDRARGRWRFDLWAFVIMPEHVHLLIRPRDKKYDIGMILKGIKQPVARRAIAFLRDDHADWLQRLRVLRPNGKIEHRFWQQGGGYDRNIFEPNAVRASIEYLHANPVRRGLVDSPTDWIWSSAKWHAGMNDCVLQMDPIIL